MGVREQIIFPEIDYDEIDQIRGLDITITTTARTDAESFALLEALGMPFREGRPPPRGGRDTGLEEHMAKLSQRVRQQRTPKYKTRGYTRCRRCGRRALGVPQVRRVPDLPARARAQRLHPRHDEVELVSRMSMTDPIADFLTRLRNAANAQHHDVDDPVLELKRELARILEEQGYIDGLRDRAADRRQPRRADHGHAEVHRATASRSISGIQRVSRPGPAHATSTTPTSRASRAAWAPRSSPPPRA